MELAVNAPSPKIHWAIFVAIALLAFLIRLPSLGERPMHTDEAVNAFITGELLVGNTYKYDPQDRHGPVLYLLAKPVAQFTGAKFFADLSESQLRLSTVIAGSVLVLLFGFGVRQFGFLTCVVAAMFFAVAPLPVYYSRYFIHETLFVAATLGLLLCLGSGREKAWLALLTGVCAALMLACKETAIIPFFALALALLGVWWVDRRTASSAPSTLTAREWAIPPRKFLLIALAAFAGVAVILFTWFGQHWQALADLFHAAVRLTARAGGEGHEKPFGYYLTLLDSTLVIYMLAAAGIYGVLCEVAAGRGRAGLALLIFGATSLLIYSAIPYKQPWLGLNLFLPLALLAGLGVTFILREFPQRGARFAAVIAGIFLLATLGAQTQTLAFRKAADEKNPLAYAHTTEDILGLPMKLSELSAARNLAAPRVAVIAADAWPLPWYLRKFANVGFWQPGAEPGAADFFITTTDVPANLTNRLDNFRPEFFGMRPNVLVILWAPPLKR